MAYPTIYNVTYSYTGYETAQNNLFPGTQLDADLAGLQASVSSLSTFTQGVMRSDGALQNNIVTYDSLSATLKSNGLVGANAWLTGTDYAKDVPVYQGFSLYRCLVAHTSGVFATDLAAGKWVLLIALPQGPSGTIAVGSVSTLAAGASATVANVGTAQAAALNFGIPQGIQGIQGVQGNTGPQGAGYGGTSATSFLIGTGSKAFTTQAGLAYVGGSRVRAASNASGVNYMEGLVTAYAGTTLTINVTSVGGSGTFADWNLSLAGDPSGGLQSANNLSDVANKAAAKDNISVHGADVASAATINLETATGDLVDVTGTTAITAITLAEGHERTVRFTGALILTNGASLVLPGGANITTAAGDMAVFRGYAAGVVRCVGYSPAAGQLSLGAQSLTATQKKQAQANILLAPTVTDLTSGSGTYTTPTGCTRIRVRMVGGGGGGGGSGTVVTAGTSGGNTTFGTSLLVANGGTSSGTASAGGSASLGTGPIGLAIGGSPGGGYNALNTQYTTGGYGGSSLLAGGAGGGTANAAGTNAVANSGSGGGGGGTTNAASLNLGACGGGAGGYVDAIINSPAATYAYAVGASGTGGAAGSGNGYVGGAGGSGRIVIEEYYGS